VAQRPRSLPRALGERCVRDAPVALDHDRCATGDPSLPPNHYPRSG